MASAVDGFEFPPELCSKPLALVGLTGLDTLNNAIHRTIWDAFCNNLRPDRAPIQFKLLDPAHEFPPHKPKRNSYEWYIPKGLLKRNWMKKYLYEIPAVIVIFYELDWNDPLWNEKKIECSSRVQSVRAALDGRSTRVAVILVQQTAPLPSGEDVLAAERAASLCASCELNAKSLFVLPHGDHLHGYTLRLENAFYDLAQNYYHHAVRNVKSHRDHLNKTTHQYLFVRHLFKMGFLNELKQDQHTAHKNYSQAYSNLLDVRMVDTNALEVKTVAGFINFKLCKLMFQLNLPCDAINQFCRHTELFKTRVGPKDLAFEHPAWLSKQYSMFGDIFEEAIKQGLPAIQTQHPGFYYQIAAQHASERKRVCMEAVTTYPDPDPLVGADQLEFYGQRAWRPGKLSAEPPDIAKERSGIQALQYNEKFRTNHSMIIIGLLGNAISQFKTYRCPRMRRQLVVEMADEYRQSRDYGKALTLLTHMLWDYRAEHWPILVSSILMRALGCAFLSASLQDYVVLCLEALGPLTQLGMEERVRVLTNLTTVLQRGIPEPEPDLPEEDVPRARELWRTLGVEPQEVAVDVSNMASCVECKAGFTRSQYPCGEPVDMEVLVRSWCPGPLPFSRLAITVGGCPEVLVFGEGVLGPGEVRSFSCQLMPDSRRDLQVTAVLLSLGTTVLRFTGAVSDEGICPELQHFRRPPRSGPDFDSARPLLQAEVAPRISQLDLKVVHAAPALIGEWYPVVVRVINSEGCPITGVTVNITLQAGADDPSLEQSTQMCEEVNGTLVSLPMNLLLGDLKNDAEKETKFHLRAHRVGNRNIVVKVLYTLALDESSAVTESFCLKEDMITVPVVKPFDITAKFFSLKFEPIIKTFAKEPFVMMPQVNCTSPIALEIVDSSVELSQHVRAVDVELHSQLRSVCLKPGDTGTEAVCVTVDQASEQPIALGIYTLQWRRADSEGLVTSSSVTMPTVRVEGAPLYVEMTLPAHGWVRTPMAVSYHIYNHTSQLLDLNLNMEASDAFMFAGHKQLQLRLLPESKRSLDYNLYPLLSGLVALPKLRLSASENGDLATSLISELLDRSLPSHVYVMPQGKGKTATVTVSS